MLNHPRWLGTSTLGSAVLEEDSGCHVWARACVACVCVEMAPWSPWVGHLCPWSGDQTQREPYLNSGQGCVRRESFQLQSHVPVTDIRATKTGDFLWCVLYFQFFLPWLYVSISVGLFVWGSSDSWQITIRKKAQWLSLYRKLLEWVKWVTVYSFFCSH